jgi:hypothetical protein
LGFAILKKIVYRFAVRHGGFNLMKASPVVPVSTC